MIHLLFINCILLRQGINGLTASYVSLSKDYPTLDCKIAGLGRRVTVAMQPQRKGTLKGQAFAWFVIGTGEM